MNIKHLILNNQNPFGMQMPLRYKPSPSGDEYRFGFNTQEKVDEVAGAGNHYTAEFWEYSPRVVHRWNTDPVFKPWLSSYAILSNNPIVRIDPNGDDDYAVNRKGEIKLIEENNNETDRLVASSNGKFNYNKKGELKNNNIELEKGILSDRSILESQDKDGNPISGLEIDFKDKEELAIKTFKFLSNNTDVEWGLVVAETESQRKSELYTSHNPEKEYFSPTKAVKLSNASNLKLLKHYHNHPREYGQSMYGEPSDSDKEFRDKVKSKFSQAQFFIYELKIMYEYTNKK